MPFEKVTPENEALFDYISLRPDLEVIAAERTAQHGGRTDHRVIAAAFERIEALLGRRDTEAETALIADVRIVQTAHNAVMLQTKRSMF